MNALSLFPWLPPSRETRIGIKKTLRTGRRLVEHLYAELDLDDETAELVRDLDWTLDELEFGPWPRRNR